MDRPLESTIIQKIQGRGSDLALNSGANVNSVSRVTHWFVCGFAIFIAEIPMPGPVVCGSGPARKVRSARKGILKSSGTRVIYYNRLDNREIWLLTIATKADRSTIPAYELKLIKEVIDRHQEKENECRRR